jgi:glutamate synthase (ferredoxin)
MPIRSLAVPGLYAPRFERDACGIGFVADAAGRSSRAIVDAALTGLHRMEHRGALAADHKSGDGAGVLLPLPRPFFARQVDAAGRPGIEQDRLGVAMAFLPGPSDGEEARAAARGAVESACRAEGLEVMGWRKVPVDLEALGARARADAPVIEQALLLGPARSDGEDGERRAFRARRAAEAWARRHRVALYLASLSFRTVTYKAMCAADQLAAFYPDLAASDLAAPFCIFHQRYSTNTSPSWARAQPFRLLCHNGEINAIQGNVNWMRAREGRLGAGHLAPDDLLRPVIDPDGSDSAMLDNAVELLVRGGRAVEHAVAMLVPEAWEARDDPASDVTGFYRYHAMLVEPWDGPAGLIFTDGIRVGAALDRNGLRPLRYAACEDGLVVCASEAGAVPLEGHGRVRRGKLGPGEMVCVDPRSGGLLTDDTVKRRLAARRPYRHWVAEHLETADAGEPTADVPADLVARQAAFGYTKEEFVYVLRPMASQGKEPTFSMGDDTQPSVLASRPRLLYTYFKQRFAQVTNPPIDHLRERRVMSLRSCLGARQPLLTELPQAARLLQLSSFLLLPGGLDQLRARSGFPSAELDATFPVGGGPAGLPEACRRLRQEAEDAVRAGSTILVVSDTQAGPDRAPLPALLAVGTVHHHLVRAGLRTQASLVVLTEEAREVHHFACLLGYGADAICPRLALQSIASLAREGRAGRERLDPLEVQRRFLHAVEDGVLKVLSKMGISTLESYRGAQIFEALGLAASVVDECFTGTPSLLGGATLTDLGRDALARHAQGFGLAPRLESPGFFKHHKGGIEFHATHPDLVKALHASVGFQATEDPDGDDVDGERPLAAAVAVAAREAPPLRQAAHLLRRAVKAPSNGHANGHDFALYQKFATLVNQRPATEPRDLLEMVPAVPPLPISEVEPAAAIVRRFSTGAMSHGSIGAEAHETLALAMNRLGGRSNTGEGGEDRIRFRSRGSPADRNSRIKQVASARFGVTPEYCAFADELQIKIAQGSKPGEGGQLPGYKVTEEIARLRHSQPGVALISPPPHHDIYSIEDLAQLIYDLKQVNPRAEVSVKLVAEAGVGTVAAGVVKGLADIVHLAGAAGGTGASPLSSIKNAGLPWELGLAETQQTLRLNGLRARVRLRVDGSLKSGRDVVMAALLGADEYSFGTAALLAEGCIMVRTCHLDTCPTGIATQRPELRAKFAGTPDMVVRYLTFVAEETRQILAGLGLRSVDEAVGRVDLLRQRRTGDARSDCLDLSPLLVEAGEGPRRFLGSLPLQRPRSPLGDRILDEALPALQEGRRVALHHRIHNGDRAVGSRLGGRLAQEFGEAAPPGRATVHFDGEAGQSFGAFLSPGVELILTGEANDYVGKGMAGGRIVVRPPANDAGEPYLMGNTVLYGATGGELFCAGQAGERFAVRNSGAATVVEGVGDHACEYMTGGTVVVLGPVGRNLGAGMTGGEAFVYAPGSDLMSRVNRELVDVHQLLGDHTLVKEQVVWLRGLLSRHASLTGSTRARAVLGRWEETLPGWWRIAPKGDVARIENAHEGTLAAARV